MPWHIGNEIYKRKDEMGLQTTSTNEGSTLYSS